MSHYASGRSFFPIGLYNVLANGRYGYPDNLDMLAEGGFNTIIPWGDQPIADTFAAADRAGLQVIWTDPSAATVAALRDHPRLLGWTIDHEPNNSADDADVQERLAAFRGGRAAIKSIDTLHPVFTVDNPAITPPRRALWLDWRQAVDIESIWKYPIFNGPIHSLSGPRGVPEVVSLARTAGAGMKPVWYVAQAFGAGSLGWSMPDPGQIRAIAYAGLIHGATGLIWFCLDTPVSREGQVIGIAPAPLADYGLTEVRPTQAGAPLIANGQELQASREIWQSVGSVNREIQLLKEFILSSTETLIYGLAVAGDHTSAAPIRSLLKRSGEDYVLLTVNLDDQRLRARFTLPSGAARLSRWFEEGSTPSLRAGRFEDEFEPFGVHVYRFRLPVQRPTK